MISTKKKYTIKKGFIKKQRKLPLTSILCFILLITVGIMYFWDDISLALPYKAGSVTKHTLSGALNRKLAATGGLIATCSNEGACAIDIHGREKWSFPTSFPNPLISVHNENTALASKNSREIYVIDPRGKSVQYVTEDPINNIKLTAGGYMTALTDKKGYNGNVSVYGKKGVALFSWSAGTSNLVDAALSENGEYLAVSALDLAENVINCRVLLFKISDGEKPYKQIEFGENLVTCLTWQSSKLLCVGDKSFDVCSKSGNIDWKMDYSGQMLNFYDISQKNNLVFVLGNSSLDRQMKVQSYRLSGKLNGTFSGEYDITAVAASPQRILVSMVHEVMLLDTHGNIKFTKESQTDIESAKIFHKGNRVLLDEGGFAEIFTIK